MAEAVVASGDGAGQRYLTFRLDADLYALPAEEVAEVIRTPAVARIPQGPRSLLGLANLRGEVLPVASLRGLLGRPQAEAEGASATDSRTIVLDGAARVALAVDGVDAMVSIPAERLETRQAELAAGPGERLRGAFQVGGAGVIAKVLDLKSLLDAAFVQRQRPAREARTLTAVSSTIEAQAQEGEKLVTFDVAGQEFGLPLTAVREVIDAPQTFALVPRAEAVVAGVMSCRDSLLPLLSLRGLLGFAAGAGMAGAKVLVTSVGGVLVGLLADRMRAIVTADPAAVEPTPPMLAARTGGESRIQAIYRGEGGRRLISILAPDQLFREDVMQRLGEAQPAQGHAAATAAEADSLQVLVFRLGAEEFALPIGAVDEVARAPEQITRVPKAPAFLEGVINLRGEVLPVVDQRRRFDMPPAPAGEARRLVVVRSDRHRAGLLVDAVSEVLTAPRDAIGEAPDLAGDAARLVQGVINLEAEGRLVLLLDPAELLTRAERGLLDAFAAEDAAASS